MTAAPRLGCVERLYLVADLSHHDSASQLEAWGELATLLGPVLGENGEPADRLGLGDGLVGFVDTDLDLRAQVGVVNQRARVLGCASCPDPGAHRFTVER